MAEPDGSGERFLVAADGGASWSADGEWIYYIGSGGVAAAEPVTCKIRVTGGEPVHVRSDTSGMAVSSDQRTGYFSPSTARQNEVWKVTPIEAGAPVLLASVSPERISLWPHQYALSPDDRWLAAPLRDKSTTDLWLVSTDDGSLRRVTDFGRRPTLIGR